MANCTYCGMKAGLFRSEHSECAINHQSGLESVKKEVQDAVLALKRFTEIVHTLENIAGVSRISEDQLQAAIKYSFDEAVEKSAVDAKVDSSAFAAINQFGEDAGLSSDEISNLKGYKAAMWALMLHHLTTGTPLDLGLDCPFNLEPGEKALISAFTQYHQDTIHRTRQGSYEGFSVPLGRGFRYSIGNYVSHSIEHHMMKKLDDGSLVLGTQNLYFQGQYKAFQIPYSKVFSVIPYNDGIGMFRKAANAKQEVFFFGAGIPYMIPTVYNALKFLTSEDGMRLYNGRK